MDMKNKMMFLEEYDIDPAKIDDLKDMLKDSKEILNTIKEPFFKDWKVYQSTENPAQIKAVVMFGEDGNLDRLLEVFLKHPKADSVISRFRALVVDGSLKQVHYNEITSLE
jgi:hypothetical protein